MGDRRPRAAGVLAALAYAGFATAIAPASAPWLMATFGLDEQGLATLFAGISLSAIAVLGLARLLDRLGRRRVLLACLAGMPLAAAGGLVAWPAFRHVLGESERWRRRLFGATVAETRGSALEVASGERTP